VLEEAEDGTFRSVPIGLSGISVLAAYARAWGLVAALGLLIQTALAIDAFEDEGLFAFVPAVAAVGVIALVVAAWTMLGRLSPAQRGQQKAYSEFAGRPVDVALLGEGREELRRNLHAWVVERAGGLMPGGYRLVHDPATQWGALALEPSVNDRAYLAAVLTLTRLEWSYAQGAVREQLASAHAALWQKLDALDPSLRADTPEPA
jgi:hypothetical protein